MDDAAGDEALVYSGDRGFHRARTERRPRAAPAAPPAAAGGPVAEARKMVPGEGAPGDEARPGWVGRMAMGMVEGTLREASLRFREDIDRYIDDKRNETLEVAREEADRFVGQSIERIERRIDRKILEIEERIDEQLEKELKTKLRILILTLLTVIGMSLLSLAYFFIKERIGESL